MDSYRLPPEQIDLLRSVHQQTQDAAVGDRIKAVLLLNQGWEPAMIAEALFIDEQNVCQYFQMFKRFGLEGLMF